MEATARTMDLRITALRIMVAHMPARHMPALQRWVDCTQIVMVAAMDTRKRRSTEATAGAWAALALHQTATQIRARVSGGIRT
jgi:hypothetical protein